MTIIFNNILLWRHAEARPADVESSENEMARELTKKGQRQAKQMAHWLKQYLPKETLLLSSPAVRAYQTAEALKTKVIISEALSPHTSLQAVLDCLAGLESSQKNLLVVGHQPWMGELVAHLTGFSGAEIDIKKGAIWWLRLSLVQPASNQTSRYKIITVQAPDLLKS
ncbi:MAG: histidine phosphatase family protein [Methylotenera sp.]